MGEAQRIGEFTQQTVAEIELPLWVMVWQYNNEFYWSKQTDYLQAVKSRWGKGGYM